MRLFRFLAYCFAFFLGAVFAFRGTNTFPAPPPKQYQPKTVNTHSGAFCGTISHLPKLDTLAQAGKTLFTQNCAACHNRNMKDDLTGPALAGVEERWAAYPKEDLYHWIRNSQAMIEAEHPRALEIWQQWQPTIMTSFPKLEDEEIEQILAYVNVVYF